MPEPNEIIVGPAEIYIAPVGEPFPAVNAAPSGNWLLIGKAGSKNYAESGVILRHPQTLNMIRTLGSTAPRKIVRSESSFEIEFNLIDLSLEAIAYGYGNEAGDVESSGGSTRLSLTTDPVPLQFAMLIRVEGQSPYVDGGNMQWQVYQAVQGGNGEGTFSKTQAFGQGQTWQAFEDSDGNFVDVVAEGNSSS